MLGSVAGSGLVGYTPSGIRSLLSEKYAECVLLKSTKASSDSFTGIKGIGQVGGWLICLRLDS